VPRRRPRPGPGSDAACWSSSWTQTVTVRVTTQSCRSLWPGHCRAHHPVSDSESDSESVGLAPSTPGRPAAASRPPPDSECRQRIRAASALFPRRRPVQPADHYASHQNIMPRDCQSRGTQSRPVTRTTVAPSPGPSHGERPRLRRWAGRAGAGQQCGIGKPWQGRLEIVYQLRRYNECEGVAPGGLNRTFLFLTSHHSLIQRFPEHGFALAVICFRFNQGYIYLLIRHSIRPSNDQQC
jgi:hypothetical protein